MTRANPIAFYNQNYRAPRNDEEVYEPQRDEIIAADEVDEPKFTNGRTLIPRYLPDWKVVCGIGPHIIIKTEVGPIECQRKFAILGHLRSAGWNLVRANLPPDFDAALKIAKGLAVHRNIGPRGDTLGTIPNDEAIRLPGVEPRVITSRRRAVVMNRDLY